MEKEFRVLLLEDSDADAELIERELHKTGYSLSTKRVETQEAFRQSVKEFLPDVILSDYRLASFDGLSALRIARQDSPYTPFIFVSGAIGEDRAIEALKTGATDYVLKDRLAGLVPTVERALKEVTDRLAREKIQEELQKSEERFRVFMDHSPAVAFLKTQEGRYVYANKPFEERFGLAQKDWFGKTDSDLWPPEMCKSVQQNDQRVLEANQAVELIEDIPTPDGVVRSWLMFRFPIGLNQSKFLGGIAIDITEHRRLETKLKQVVGEMARLNAELDKKNDDLKKLDQLKSDFVSTVSHELRTPMTIMRESISQIVDKLCGDLTAVQQKRLSMVLNNIDRLRHIVDNLLDVSKLESHKAEPQKESVDLVALAKEAGSSFESQLKKKGLDLQYHFSNKQIEVDIDKGMITQVFVNLIWNAIKFTDQGRIGISITDTEKNVECRIVDTGKGIEKHNLTKLFNKFEQFGRQEGPGERGTGLGLTICKEIVKLHLGEIWAESTFGQGSEFIFTLPKFSLKELFFEDLSQYLQNTSPKIDFLSILILEINNWSAIQDELGPEKVHSLEAEIVRLMKRFLRRKDDRVVYNGRFILIILPETRKDSALIVSGRIQQNLDDFLIKESLRSKVEMTVKAAVYPADGKDAKELLERAGFL